MTFHPTAFSADSDTEAGGDCGECASSVIVAHTQAQPGVAAIGTLVAWTDSLALHYVYEEAASPASPPRSESTDTRSERAAVAVAATNPASLVSLTRSSLSRRKILQPKNRSGFVLEQLDGDARALSLGPRC